MCAGYLPQLSDGTRCAGADCRTLTGLLGLRIFFELSPPGSLDEVSVSGLRSELSFHLPPVAIQFTGYIVDGSHIQLIETDQVSPGTGFGSTGGIAIGQGSATGTFTSNSALSGNLVFRVLGFPYGGSGLGAAFGMGALVTADGGGNLNGGTADYVNANVPFLLTDSLAGTYSLDATGTGRAVAITTFASLGVGPTFVFYLTGNGTPA